MLDEVSDVFPVDQPGLPPERSVAMEIELEEGAKPVTKLICSTYRLPCIDFARIDIPHLGSTFRFHTSHCHVTYVTIRGGPARHVSNCHFTHITTRDGSGTPRISFPSLITPSTQYL
jgi:hypothetical protein